MSKKFSIKQLARGMHMHDKARIIIEHYTSKAENDGMGILNYAEEEALIVDARKNNEIPEIRRIYDIWKAASMSEYDIYQAHQRYLLTRSHLDCLILANSLANRAQDAIGHLLYDAYFSKNLLEEPERILSKQGNHSLDSILRFCFTENAEARSLLTQALENVISSAKALCGKRYQFRYLIGKSPITITSEQQEKIVKQADASLTDLAQLKGNLTILKLFRDHPEVFVKGKDGLPLQSLVKKLKDIVYLSEPRKLELENEIEKYLKM